LSDLVSFGLAPAILLYQWALLPFDRLGWLAAFLYAACGALRLARFNVNSGILPKSYFQGLPIPMAAGMVATFVIFNQTVDWPTENPATGPSKNMIVLLLTFGLASLMVSTIKFPSFKEFNWRSRASFGYLLVGVLAMILIAVRPEVTLFLLLSIYILLSLLWNLVRLITKSQSIEKEAQSRPQR
jgi:CDP-diacylglycerol--serine O-phosphatidyltransferase